MRLLSVTGHGNGSGKTSVAKSLVEGHPGRFAAVKFTTIFREGQNCPKDARRRCACAKLHGAFTVITDPAILATPGTDTGHLVAAGASPVAWCLAREGSHAEAWTHVAEVLAGSREAVTEGNTSMLVIGADVVLFVVNPSVPRATWKAGWEEALARADAIVVNDAPEALKGKPVASEEERATNLHDVLRLRPDIPRVAARFEQPWSTWAAPTLEALIGPQHSLDSP